MIGTRFATVRVRLRQRVDGLFPQPPQTAEVSRAMLLRNRSFVARAVSVAFQKPRIFRVLVVADEYAGALAFFLNWLSRKLRVPHSLAVFLLLTLLLGHVAVMEQRNPALRAGLLVANVVKGSFLSPAGIA